MSSLSSKEHEDRVAAAQSRIFAKLERSKLHYMEPTTSAGVAQTSNGTATRQPPPKLSRRERRAILRTVEHWLTKDSSFLASTMEALDLNLGGNTIAKKKESHPLQAVWDQYRQLYYESIPEFVNELTRGKPTTAEILIELENLKMAGFGDERWNRQYRQVKRYQINQEELARHITRQSIRIAERQEELTTTLKSQKSLEENLAIKILLTPDQADPEILGTNGGDDSGKARANDRKDRTIAKEISNDKHTLTNPTVTSSDESSSSVLSFFERAWSSLSSSIFGNSKSRPSNSLHTGDFQSRRPRDESNTIAGDRSDGVISEDGFSSKGQKRDRNTVARLKKRIERKQLAARQLQQEIDVLETKLRQIEKSKALSKPPIPLDEYERAKTVVEEARQSICDEFSKYIKERHKLSIQQYQTLDAKTDLTKPHEWYPYARLDRRRIIFHGGPTNSGKTYSALQRLKEAKKGLYLGPLRLLAAEVYETLTAEGLYTNLFTGQERREIPFSTHTAATVEMCNVTEEYDIVVIDEIQMIGDASRGASWTKALMGLRCKEIHVCGGKEAMEIVQKIASACGDDFESISYERFSDLSVSNRSLSRNPKTKGSYRKVQPGDCIVAFSRNDIFAIKREIESLTDYKCCVIYGKLPPQTRADQARRFNDPDSGYDILVASDAIGMGLNLNIKRIIFNSIFKFNGEKIIRLSHSEIKQISGRAGRRNSPYPNGEVTCLDHRDLKYIRECLSTDIEPLRKAALVPTEAHIELFAQAIYAYTLNNANEPDLHEILRQFSAMATVKGDFFLGRQNEMTVIAKRLKHIPIRLRDAYMMCLSPINENSLGLLETFATKVSQGEVFGLPTRPVPKRARSFDDLSHLCNIYADVDLFMWLQYKFPPGNAVELAAALARKERTMEFINSALLITEQLKLDHCYLKMSSHHRRVWESKNGVHESSRMGVFVEDDDDDDDIRQFEFEENGDVYYDSDDEYYIYGDKEAVY